MKNITVKELKQVLDKKEDINLIDVRENYEHAKFNIGGVNTPLRKLLENTDQIDKNKKTILYCRSDARSGVACNFLEKNGFNNVYNLTGGTLEWQKN